VAILGGPEQSHHRCVADASRAYALQSPEKSSWEQAVRGLALRGVGGEQSPGTWQTSRRPRSLCLLLMHWWRLPSPSLLAEANVSATCKRARIRQDFFLLRNMVGEQEYEKLHTSAILLPFCGAYLRRVLLTSSSCIVSM
jgi:hypothetical protein